MDTVRKTKGVAKMKKEHYTKIAQLYQNIVKMEETICKLDDMVAELQDEIVNHLNAIDSEIEKNELSESSVAAIRKLHYRSW